MRTLFVAFILIASACSLVSCGKSGNSLVIAVNAGVEGSALKAAAQQWAEQKGIRAEVVELPYANLFEKELLDLTSHTGAYDVVMLDDPWFPRLAEHLEVLPKEPDGDFVKPALDVCRLPYKTGAYRALPYVGNSQVFFYRGDLFEKYKMGKPDTWQHVLEAAKKIGAGEKMYGYVMRAAPGNAVVADFMPLLWAFGGEMFDAAEMPALTKPEAIEALKFMIELGKYAPPGYTGFNADEVAAHLLQSTAVMSINWPAWIAAMDNPAKSNVVGKVEFAVMPSAKAPGVGELGSWLVAVPAGGKNKAAAFEFIHWATDPERQKEAAMRGNPPTRKSVFERQDLREKYRSYPVQLKSLEGSRPRPRTAQWNEIENAFGIYLSQANSGSLTPEEAMQKAEAEIRQILARGR
ncbi:MAG: extracellular solute-binding protein [Bryobacteraceae bacterium]